ncbi:hypothetical protein ACE1ET_13655 [Saccharicrinis sp. FJH62]|uniref:hypothetical protein n=1 Tax=Saccharicrinis sp. FJH62 TaxID=3344657 RepID=UPI0035D4A88A
MNGLEFIKQKQISWANRNDIILSGSKSISDQKIYVQKLADNLFTGISKETVDDFNNGDGGELNYKNGFLPKMFALHSSSAIGVNIFEYWRKSKQIKNIAYACGLCNINNSFSQDIQFEKKFEISKSFRFAPNLDVVIKNSDKSTVKLFGIECKFSESYSSRKHDGISEKYLKEIPEQWKDISYLKELAEEISPNDNKFKYLHAAQLIKHILGLKKNCGKSAFRLLYLWYDVYGFDGSKHREEIDQFKRIAVKDNVKFHSISYQELIVKMKKHFYVGNEKYIDYLTNRYL